MEELTAALTLVRAEAARALARRHAARVVTRIVTAQMIIAMGHAEAGLTAVGGGMTLATPGVEVRHATVQGVRHLK